VKIRILLSVAVLVLALGLLLLGAGCGFDSEASADVGWAAPSYEAPTMDGEVVSLEDFRGRVVLLNMWATWCPPCRWEMPHLQQLHDELYGEGLRVVGVSVDSSGSDRQVRQFLEGWGSTSSSSGIPRCGATGFSGATAFP
jgi:thiol-disulfide isomerase/thioredoxin